MAFDRSRQRTVLFGGRLNGAVTSADTWQWDGNTWIERKVANAPPSRERAALAYDELRQKVVLFGGSLTAQATALNDTWQWGGERWTQVFPAQVPPARAGHALAYDRERARIVLFGGDDAAQSQELLSFGDVWEWDGTRWIERSVSEQLAADNVGKRRLRRTARPRRAVWWLRPWGAVSYLLDETWE